MKSDEYIQYIQWRIDKFFNATKDVLAHNPDRLSDDELKALSAVLFHHLNVFFKNDNIDKIDISRPYTIPESRQRELFVDFLDWYEIVPTSSNILYRFVKKMYPIEQFPRILSVGDGITSHLGRKLATEGYRVISIDPRAREEFSINETNTGGSLKVRRGLFSRFSSDLLNEADLVVGAKVPMLAPDLIKLPVPTVFNISINPEIHGIYFNGIKITSYEQLKKLIMGSPGIKTIQANHRHIPPGFSDDSMNLIFVQDGQRKRGEHPFPEEK
ncbi:MAG: hypothetical protein IKM97_05780 [Clostridia bacterium]|nr:hypothetical protein [Clostridia bacterium]